MLPPLTALLLALAEPAQVKPFQPTECLHPATLFTLKPETVNTERVVCLTPGLTTTLLFDGPLPRGAVDKQQTVRFERVDVAESTLTLLPPKDLRPGEKLQVEVRFEDEAAPASITLTLIGTSWGPARQVEIHRQPRNLESYQREVNHLRGELHQSYREQELLQLASGRLTGLRELTAEGYLGPSGVAARNLTKNILWPTAMWYELKQVIGYSTRIPKLTAEEPPRVLVAVRLELKNLGRDAWLAQGALLEGPKGTEPRVMQVAQPQALQPDEENWFMAEVELTEAEAQGTWSLLAWDEGGEHLIGIGNITFP